VIAVHPVIEMMIRVEMMIVTKMREIEMRKTEMRKIEMLSECLIEMLIETVLLLVEIMWVKLTSHHSILS
jgi:hypothetical protein